MSSGPSIFDRINHEIFLITSAWNGEKSGFIATWVLPASLQAGTPRIMFLSSPLNFTHSLILKSQAFNMHLLAEGQEYLLQKFGLSSGKNKNKFTGIPGSDFQDLPVIAETVGWAAATVDQIIDIGERQIVIGRVNHQELSQKNLPLSKATAFAALPENIRKQLKEKHHKIASTSAKLWPL